MQINPRNFIMWSKADKTEGPELKEDPRKMEPLSVETRNKTLV